MFLRAFLTRILSIWNYFLDSLLLVFLAFMQPRLRPGADKPILMLVRVDRIGDFVLWLPSAQRMAEAYRKRGYRVVAIVNRDCMALARALDGLDEVWPLDTRLFRLDPVYRAGFLARVRRCGAGIAVQATYSRVLSLGDAIIRFSGAAQRIGWAGDHNNATPLEKRLGDRFYTDLLCDNDRVIRDLRLNEALLERLGIPLVPFERLPLPRLPLAGTLPPGRYYILAPGASKTLKQWPAANFARLALRLHQETGWTGIICGSRSDRPLAEEIMKNTDIPLLDLTGGTGLEQLTTVIAGSEIVISNDSSAAHLAAALGKSCVCIAGGGHYGRFIPYEASRLFDYARPRIVAHFLPCFGCNWVCHYRNNASVCAPCIGEITVDEVWSALEDGGNLLAQRIECPG